MKTYSPRCFPRLKPRLAAGLFLFREMFRISREPTRAGWAQCLPASAFSSDSGGDGGKLRSLGEVGALFLPAYRLRSSILRPLHQLRQLGEVDGYAPSFVAREQIGRRSPSRLIFVISEASARPSSSFTMKHEPLSSMVQGGGKRRQGIGYAWPAPIPAATTDPAANPSAAIPAPMRPISRTSSRYTRYT